MSLGKRIFSDFIVNRVSMEGGDEQNPQVQAANGAQGALPFLNTQVPLPPRLSIERDMAGALKKWRQIWDSFELVTGLNKRPKEYRVATFVTCI